MSVARTVANAGSGAAARLLSAALGLALIVMMTRLWDADNLGRFVVAYSWFQLLQLVPLLGLHFELAREAVADADAVRPQLAAATLLSLVCALPTAALLVSFGALLYPSELLPALALAATALIPTAPITVAEMALLGRERLGVVALVNVGESALRCLVLCGLIVAGAGVLIVLGAFVALRSVALALYLADPVVRDATTPRAATVAVARSQLARAPVLFAVLVLSSTFSRIDVVLLPLFLDLEDVGIYGIAARLYDLCLMIPAVLVMALLPVFTRLDGPCHSRMETLAQLILRYALGTGVPLALVAAWLTGPTLAIVFGPRFAAAADPFRILLVATLVTGVNQLMSCALLARNLQRLELPCLAVGCAVLLVSIAVLAPRYGITGAGMAVLAGTIAQFLLRERLLRRQGGIVLARGELAGPALGGLAALLIVIAGAGGAWVYPIALGTYGVLLLALRGVRRGDGELLRSLLKTEQQPASTP